MTHRQRDMWRWPLSHWPNDPKTATVRTTLARRARKVEKRAVAPEIDEGVEMGLESQYDEHTAPGAITYHGLGRAPAFTFDWIEDPGDEVTASDLRHAWLNWKESHPQGG